MISDDSRLWSYLWPHIVWEMMLLWLFDTNIKEKHIVIGSSSFLQYIVWSARSIMSVLNRICPQVLDKCGIFQKINVMSGMSVHQIERLLKMSGFRIRLCRYCSTMCSKEEAFTLWILLIQMKRRLISYWLRTEVK